MSERAGRNAYYRRSKGLGLSGTGHGIAIKREWIRVSYSERAGHGRLSFFEQYMYQQRFIHLEWGEKTPLK